MKRFSFPLESVRVWRFRQLESEEGRLRQVLNERDALITRRHAMEEELRKELGMLTAPGLEAEQLAALDAFRRYVGIEKRRLGGEIRECEQRIDAQRKQVVEAGRRFELLNRLREKAALKWRAENSRELENTAADLYLARCARERRSPVTAD